MLQESGNLRSDFTGGYDGLPGLIFAPLFGRFDYDLYGHTNYLYVLAVLAVMFYFVRRIVYSPFGQALTGIRENVRRMHAIGSPVHRRLVTVYTIGAGIAGVAGALFTQTNAYVTLTVFDFDNSAKVMVMLILGGTGRLYGAFVGAVVYMVLEDKLSKFSPDLLAVRHRADAGAGGAVCAPRPARADRGRRPLFLAEEDSRERRAQVERLNRSFGALQVTRDVDLTLERGARRALIGPNGAGKTTLVNLITGVLAPSTGRVLLDGEDITGTTQAERARRGLARTFQINQLFRGLTVLENVAMAISERDGHANNLWRPVGTKRAILDEALDHLASLRLVDDALKLIRELPYGRQRLVEIAIALAQRPRVLLLDEPAAGVPSSESHLILDVVARLDPDIAILIIEHDMDVVMRFAKEITVLVAGAVLTQGTPAEIMANEDVRAVYLGEEGHKGAPWLSARSNSTRCSPATARPWCWKTSTSRIEAGETVSIIGRNGVGKSTLLSTIMGHTTLHGGAIRLHGKDIVRLATYRRVAAGLGLVPQEREIFPSLSLKENLEVAARPGEWTLEKVYELFPRLAERAGNRGNQLSGGEQQMLAIGRALIGNPTVLLMDEPSEGLAPVIVEELARAVKRLTKAGGLSTVLVEQNSRLALDIAPRAVVMDRGRIVYDGTSEALRNDPARLDQLIGVAKA